MAEISDDRIELLERQLAEKVTNRVRPALFRLYAAIGGSVIVVLGFVGWDIITDIKSEIKSEITDEIDKEIASKRAEIEERVAETSFMAKRANQVIERLEKLLNDFQPQAENLEDTIEKVRSLKVTAQDLTAAYSQDLKPLITNVESISSQLKVLAEQVNALNDMAVSINRGPEVEPDPVQQQRSETIQIVISDTEKSDQRYAEARRKTTVFFQFAGSSREQAEELIIALKAKGYIVPSEDREKGAVGKREVRYFHEEDKETAQDLAQVTNDALRDLEYSRIEIRKVKPKSFTSYGGKKPRPGVVELWLEIPSR